MAKIYFFISVRLFPQEGLESLYYQSSEFTCFMSKENTLVANQRHA